jgi:hypothetical protein
VGLSHERSDVAGAEGFYSLEGNMCDKVLSLNLPCGTDQHGGEPYRSR